MCFYMHGYVGMFMYMFVQHIHVHVSACVHVCTFVCVRMWRPELDDRCFPLSLSYFMRQGLLLNLELTESARLVLQQGPGTIWFLTPRCWTYRPICQAQLFTWVLKTGIGFSSLRSKHFTNLAISLAWS